MEFDLLDEIAEILLKHKSIICTSAIASWTRSKGPLCKMYILDGDDFTVLLPDVLVKEVSDPNE